MECTTHAEILTKYKYNYIHTLYTYMATLLCNYGGRVIMLEEQVF